LEEAKHNTDKSIESLPKSIVKAHRVEPLSKTNFSILNQEEKRRRLKNLAKLVKKMKRQLKNINLKMRKNAPKLLNKFINDYLKGSSKITFNSNEKIYSNLDFDQLCEAFETLNSKENSFEYEDERFIFQNLISALNEGRLSPSSIQFNHISSILRTLTVEHEGQSDHFPAYIGEEKPYYFTLEDGKLNKLESSVESYLTGSKDESTKYFISKIEYEYLKKMNKESDNVFLKSFYLFDQHSNNQSTIEPISNNFHSPVGNHALFPASIQTNSFNVNTNLANTFIFPTQTNSCSLIHFEDIFSKLPAFLTSSQPEIENHLLDLLLEPKYKRMLNCPNYNKGL